MLFSRLLKREKSTVSNPQGYECYADVNGKPTNAQICEDMLSGGVSSSACADHLVSLAKGVGFSDIDAVKYWGFPS